MTTLTIDTRAAVLEVEGPISSESHCLVCYDSLVLTTKTPCWHDEICPKCHLRLRFLQRTKLCPICKAENEHVIADAPSAKTFDTYPLWGDSLGADFIYREDVGMFFPVEYFEREIKPLFGYHCTVPNCDFDGHQQVEQESGHNQSSKPITPLRALQDHLRTQHRLAICQLCIDHQRDFVARLPRLTPAQIKSHLTQGGGLGGFNGHPLCEFCRNRYYDITLLHQHLQKDHYKCHVCEKQGLDNQYFATYQSLERHFDRAHFLCLDVQCLTARFVVFGDELDLRHHERQVHGGTSSSNKIQLEFRVRRPGAAEPNQTLPSESDFNYDLDGQAFVPAELPATGLTLHPLHVQRTAELRERAAQIRLAQESDSFPTLASANAEATQQQQPLRVGWNEGATLNKVTQRAKAGEVTEEDFPALPAAPKLNPRIAKVRVGTAGQRQFAAMNLAGSASHWSDHARHEMTAPQSAPSTNLVSASVRTQVNHNPASTLSAENFPSLGPAPSHQSQYASADWLAKKNRSHVAADNFPTLSETLQRPVLVPVVAAPKPQQQVPALNSDTEFPAPPTASKPQKDFRQKVTSGSQQPSKAAMANVLHAPSASSKATVDDMKATLGNRYKSLKNYTKEFASGQLEPEAFVDHAASLFDQGYADPDFWRFLPALLDSCPDLWASSQARRYMETLKATTKSVGNVGTVAPPQPDVGVVVAPTIGKGPWTNVSSSQVTVVPVIRQAAPTSSAATYSAVKLTTAKPSTGSAKVKNAWGGAVPSTTIAKVPPGSVAAAAARVGPQTGTATKFMAQESKQEKQHDSATTNKKNKKQNKELRQLAFGM